jgi:hypothetical protein
VSERVVPGLISPAFSRSFKLLALVLVTAMASWMYQLWSTGKLSSNSALSPSNGLIWLLCGLALMLYTLFAFYTSKTSISETHLKQTWIWDKEVALPELTYAKLIRVRGLDWLIAPRLYVRTMMGKFHVFYASDKPMIHAFEKLVASINQRSL